MKHLIISVLLLATPLLSRAASSYVNTYNMNGINRSAIIYDLRKEFLIFS